MNTASFRAFTNWTVARGSLENTVTFESSSSPIDQTALNSEPKSRLILHSASHDYDFGPCLITISFMQKHVVRRVNLRSTVRGYNISYAPDMQSGNKHLCNVWGFKRTEVEEVLYSSNSEEAVSSCSQCNDRNSCTNEDSWFEVEGPDGPVLENRNIALLPTSDVNTGKCVRVFYEDIAEISDANPCISLTLRLFLDEYISCVHIDDVYVFADPADSENKEVCMENCGLMPALLRLDERMDPSQIQDAQIFDISEKQKVPEITPEATDTSSNATTQQEGKSCIDGHENVQSPEVNRTSDGPPQFQILSQVSDIDCKRDFKYGRIEMAMDHLVPRVSKIDICLRFEENMPSPISCNEAMLQGPEKQLEEVEKKSQNPGLPSRIRIPAPEFSNNESGDGIMNVSVHPISNQAEDVSSTDLAAASGSEVQMPDEDAPLLLSKTMWPSQIQDTQNFDTSEKQKVPNITPAATDTSSNAATTQQEGKSNIDGHENVEVYRTSDGPPEFQFLSQVSDIESKLEMKYAGVEIAMDYLFSHVRRVCLCLRFEENMPRPISSNEAMLQHPEKQLEEVEKKSQNPGLPSGIRIPAPEFSNNESGDVSVLNPISNQAEDVSSNDLAAASDSD